MVIYFSRDEKKSAMVNNTYQNWKTAHKQSFGAKGELNVNHILFKALSLI